MLDALCKVLSSVLKIERSQKLSNNLFCLDAFDFTLNVFLYLFVVLLSVQVALSSKEMISKIV